MPISTHLLPIIKVLSSRCAHHKDKRGGIALSKHEDMILNAIAFDYQDAGPIGMYAQDKLIDNYFRSGSYQ
ncbi:hypothetical protein AAW12_24405 [Sphingobacterium sp. Ag1]|nr:hypothetical protein AAW12_24405 [Sphingobacterium sp. Ag1]